MMTHPVPFFLLFIALPLGIHALECGNPCEPTTGTFDPDAVATDGLSCQAYLDTTTFGDINCPFNFTNLPETIDMLEALTNDMEARGCCDKGWTTSCQVCPTVKINEDMSYDASLLGPSFDGVVDCEALVDNRQAAASGRVLESSCLQFQEQLVAPIPCCKCDDTILDCATIEASIAPVFSPSPPPTVAPFPSSAFHAGGTIASLGVAAVVCLYM